MPTLRFANKTAFVTTAGQGIGRTTAIAFAAHGARVIATDINAQALATLQDDIGYTVHAMDVTEPLAIAAVAQSAGPTQVFFNGAGLCIQAACWTAPKTNGRLRSS